MADPLPVLETGRLRLRGFELHDAAALAESLTPAVTKWLASWPDPTTIEIAVDRIRKIRTEIEAGRHISYAVVRKMDGRVIGGFGGGIAEHDPQRMELGYHLAEHCHGTGLMREAISVALPVIWRLLPVQVIEAGAQPANEASFRLMRSLGMTPAGERLVYAPARDRQELCLFYELRRPVE